MIVKMLNKISRNFCLIFGVFFCANVAAKECESQYSSIIIDEKNLRIISENRAEKYIYPASLTKVMTLYLVFEALEKKQISLEQKIKISDYAQDISQVNKVTTLHLKEGDEITVEDAIKGSAIKSFNETALALAELVGGNEWNFVRMMNEKAKSLKMLHTNFRNSTGLHEDGQYSTIYDLARLLIATEKKFPQYRKYFGQKEFVYRDKKYVTHNNFLAKYEGASGFKTGFTSKAGFNLMATAKRGEHSLSAVIVGCETFMARDNYAKEIFDYSFDLMSFKDDAEEKIVLNGSF